ncbi:hypothetical protein DPEC_G00159270 [Dallia pectoralis]|uniref:Uncharacterized protein n=1 Tax=Dallia pectoralis TaxID=75939 RepID=A0ACC2GG11_DALPE|nr:hypothetical protein DPEC_G00159270 [Dallia pectoralis]
MGISRQTIKPRRASSTGRPGTPHTPRRARLSTRQSRSTTPVRNVQIRPPPPRATPTRATPTRATPSRATPTLARRPPALGALTQGPHARLALPPLAGRRGSRDDRRRSFQAPARLHPTGCTFYCYLLGDSLGALSSASTLDALPSTGPLARPRTLLRQQSLQQPLVLPPAPSLTHLPPTSQSLGQLHQVPPPGHGLPGGGGVGGGVGGSRGARGSPAGSGASRCRGGGGAGGGARGGARGGAGGRGNPGSWDHMMGQLKNRGLDAKSFL